MSTTRSRTRPVSAGPSRAPRFDWPTLVANKDKEIARLEGIYAANVEKTGARIVKTRAVLEDAHTLRLIDRRDGAPRSTS